MEESIYNIHFIRPWWQCYLTQWPIVQFLVVKMALSFNLVIGRPTLTEIRAIMSQSYLCMKFSTPMGIATLKGNQEIARHCYMMSVTRSCKDKEAELELESIQTQPLSNNQVMGIQLLDNRLDDEPRATPGEEVEKVQINKNNPQLRRHKLVWSWILGRE